MKYRVLFKDKEAGWAKATVKDFPGGKSLSITSKIHTKIMGKKFSLSSKTFVKYDTEGKATYFDVWNESPIGSTRVVGKRSGSGYDITRSKDGKSEVIRIEDGSYDLVSLEPALWSGTVGSKVEKRILMAGQGKVGKAKVSILGREKKTILGSETQVTHFKIENPAGSIEEWRAADGVLVRSKIKAPVGTISIELKF